MKKNRPKLNHHRLKQEPKVYNAMEILVFKTNIRNKKQLGLLMPHLQKIQGIHQWNVDMHDRDKILRVQSINVAPHTIENTVRQAGYQCEELT